MKTPPLLLSLCCLALAGASERTYRRPYLLPVEGVIDEWAYATFRRRAEAALAAGADLVVVALDTPGGELNAAFKFSRYLFNDLRPRTHLVFYVEHQALSAGALLALTGHEIVMGPGATLGDCEPILLGPGGMAEGPEKIQSPLRARFRQYAAANGYPVALAESMVTKELEVLRLRLRDGSVRYERRDRYESWPAADKQKVVHTEVVVPKGELLTLAAKEARDYGFARAVVPSLDALGELYGVRPFRPTVLRPTWSEELVHAVESVSFLLILLGLLCLYLEFKTPGFGFFGIVGLVCLALYFFVGYLSGLSDYWEIALCVVGLVLIGLEIFVLPGFGLPGILGLLCLLVGLFAAGLPDFILPRTPWEVPLFERALLRFSLAVAGVLVLAVLLSRYLPSLPGLRRLVLATPSSPPHSQAIPPPSARAPVAVGARGVALTPLRPAGTARFGTARVSVVTRGEFVERGRPVRVIRIQANEVVVAEGPAE